MCKLADGSGIGRLTRMDLGEMFNRLVDVVRVKRKKRREKSGIKMRKKH